MTQVSHIPPAGWLERITPLPSAQSSSDLGITLAYDARYATADPSGIGQMCLELLRGFADLTPPLPLQVLVNAQTRLPEELWTRPHLTFHSVPWSPYGLANQLHLPRWLRKHQIRLLHSVDSHNPLLGFGGHLIVNVHDLIPLTCTLRCARSMKARFRLAWWSWLKLQCSRAHRVVCGSQHAAQDIVRLLRLDPRKVAVIPNPIRQWSHSEPPERLRQRLSLSGRVISYVGRQEPYKNVVTLIRAVPLLNRMLQGTPVSLVVAGNLDERYPEARRETQRLGLEKQIVFPGYLDEASLGALYRISEVFVFPSLYEGFGMPPLEAMRFGTPVVAGRHTCLPEVLGDAALYVDTQDPQSLAHGIVSVLREEALARRLRVAGFRQVERYSGREVAGAYVRIYREILQEIDSRPDGAGRERSGSSPSYRYP